MYKNKYYCGQFLLPSVGLSDPQGQHCGLWDLLLATPVNVRITWAAESSYPTLRVYYLALLYV